MLKSRDIFLGFSLALLSSAIALVLFFMPDLASALSPGRMTAGHEGLACDACHKAAPGTMRQQIQANVAHWVGRRTEGTPFGNRPVASAECIACHTRKDDDHPVHCFRERAFWRPSTRSTPGLALAVMSSTRSSGSHPAGSSADYATTAWS